MLEKNEAPMPSLSRANEHVVQHACANVAVLMSLSQCRALLNGSDTLGAEWTKFKGPAKFSFIFSSSQFCQNFVSKTKTSQKKCFCGFCRQL